MKPRIYGSPQRYCDAMMDECKSLDDIRRVISDQFQEYKFLINGVAFWLKDIEPLVHTSFEMVFILVFVSDGELYGYKDINIVIKNESTIIFSHR